MFKNGFVGLIFGQVVSGSSGRKTSKPNRRSGRELHGRRKHNLALLRKNTGHKAERHFKVAV